MSAAGALKARRPTKPIAPVAANKIPPAPDNDQGDDRPAVIEDAGYMVAGG